MGDGLTNGWSHDGGNGIDDSLGRTSERREKGLFDVRRQRSSQARVILLECECVRQQPADFAGPTHGIVESFL